MGLTCNILELANKLLFKSWQNSKRKQSRLRARRSSTDNIRNSFHFDRHLYLRSSKCPSWRSSLHQPILPDQDKISKYPRWFSTYIIIQIALFVGYCMSKFSVFTSDLKNHYPPYLSMLLVNSMVCINMMFTTYFFNGATFDYDTFWGIFSIVSQKHFAAFMYMAIILCMGLVISFVMISNLFPDPIIPSLAMAFEPALATLFLYLGNIQNMPPALSFIGYILIIPGNFLILIGQWMFQIINKKKKQE